MRKCGIGRALMAKIHKIAEKEKAAIIATNPESHHAAHALYRKLGEFWDLLRIWINFVHQLSLFFDR